MTNTIEVDKKDMKRIFWGDCEEYETVEDGEWEQDGKCQYATNILRDKEGRHWSLTASRSGSPFTDWYYSWEHEGEDMYEVETKEITTTIWAIKE